MIISNITDQTPSNSTCIEVMDQFSLDQQDQRSFFWKSNLEKSKFIFKSLKFCWVDKTIHKSGGPFPRDTCLYQGRGVGWGVQGLFSVILQWEFIHGNGGGGGSGPQPLFICAWSYSFWYTSLFSSCTNFKDHCDRNASLT